VSLGSKHFIIEKKIVEHRLHLLVECSSYLVFPRYIFISLCGWCVICLFFSFQFSLFSIFFVY
jgi:hypothetical protein